MADSWTKTLSRSLTPEPLKIWMKRLKRGLDLRDDLSPAVIGPNPGPVAETFRKLRQVRGAFTLDDAGFFLLTLRMQTTHGMTGDLLEIGSYHGRSTAVMCQGLAAGERIHVCDAFELEGGDDFAMRPTPELLRRNIARANPNLAEDRVVIHNCLSQDLTFLAEQRFRFIHIDGGHADEICSSDLRLAQRHILPGGVIVVDDYAHPDWRGVSTATDRFLAENPGFQPILDVNRHGEKGRKLYLAAPRD